jgi:hypothetical protein
MRNIAPYTVQYSTLIQSCLGRISRSFTNGFSGNTECDGLVKNKIAHAAFDSVDDDG